MIKAHGLHFVEFSLLLDTTGLTPEEWHSLFNAASTPIVMLRARGRFFFEVEASSMMLADQGRAKEFWNRFVRRQGLKRKLTKAQKVKVAAAQQWRCMRCNDLLNEMFEVDHVEQHCLTSDDSFRNLQALCVRCHRRKTQDDLYVTNPYFYKHAESNLHHDAVRRETHHKSIEENQQNRFSKYFHRSSVEMGV